MRGAIGATLGIILITLALASCGGHSSSSHHSDSTSTSSYSSSYSGKSSGYATKDLDSGYDHILNDRHSFDHYGYDSPSVSENEAFITKLGDRYVFVH